MVVLRSVLVLVVGLGHSNVYGDPPPASLAYEQLSIVEPLNQATLRDHGGEVTVRVELTPPLQLALRHRLKLLVDGRSHTLRDGAQTLVLKNVDRGTHDIVALVVDSRNVEILRSAPVTIYLHRRSLLHPNQKAKHKKKPK